MNQARYSFNSIYYDQKNRCWSWQLNQKNEGLQKKFVLSHKLKLFSALSFEASACRA
ncbi:MULTISPECIES: hypothetical protein [Acinetobacter]|uniref:hypothetical protein n=1 Tax=Acinetobacter TaxID=469 RepID=UPI00148ADED1|nr:hypothetical protein [Acinetobacter pittii]